MAEQGQGWHELIQFLNEHFHAADILKVQAFKKNAIRVPSVKPSSLIGYLKKLIELGYIEKRSFGYYALLQKIPEYVKFQREYKKRDSLVNPVPRVSRDNSRSQEESTSYGRKNSMPVYTIDLLEGEKAKLEKLLDPRYGDLRKFYRKYIEELENCKLLIMRHVEELPSSEDG